MHHGQGSVHSGQAVRSANPSAETAPPRAPLIHEANDEISQATARAIGLYDQVRMFADGILGSTPTAVGVGANTKDSGDSGPTPRGEVLRTNLYDLYCALSALEGEVRRLGNI